MKSPADPRHALDQARLRLERAMVRLTDADYERPISADNWTVHAVLLHIAAWDDVGRQTVDEIAAGVAPTRYFSDVDGFNHAAVADRAISGATPAAITAKVRANRQAFLAALAAAPERIWAQSAIATTGESVSIVELLDTWTRHDIEHAAELEVFLADETTTRGGSSAD